MNYNWNGVIDFLKSQIKDCNQREELWQEEKIVYQRKVQDLSKELLQQKEINQQLVERLDSIKFAFQPITENFKKTSKPTKVGHHRVKSDMDYRHQSNFIQIQPLMNTQSSNEKKKEHTPLLMNFLKDLNDGDAQNGSSPSSVQHPHQVSSMNILIQPNSQKNPSILINQTNYTTFNSGSLQTQTALQKSSHQTQYHHHHHQRSNSNGASGTFLNSRQLKDVKYEQIQTEFSLSSVRRNSINERDIVIGKNVFEIQGVLRGHMDGVRSITINKQILASASEDCTIKIWDVEQFKNLNDINLEPLTTIRQHVGPIFTITSFRPNQMFSKQQSYFNLYSAGIDGYIRQNSFPYSQGQEFDTRKEISHVWSAHSDVIWSLNHHPTDSRLLSLSADGTVKMWKTYDKLQCDMSFKNTVNKLLQNPLASFTFKRSINGPSVPTASDWICSKSQSEKVVCGYSDSVQFVLYDVETVKIASQFKFFQNEATSNHLRLQPNKILYNGDQNCLISGHEDSCIRFCDPQSGKIMKVLVGHADSVTDLTMFNDNLISSVSHDGSMRTWDMRTFQCLHEIAVHKRKYDESIHTVNSNRQYVATGGADGLIKIFKQSQI